MKAFVSIISISSVNYCRSYFFLFSAASILLSFFSWPTSFLSRFLLLWSLPFLLIFLIFSFIYIFSFSLFHFSTFWLSLFLSLSLILPYSFSFYVCWMFLPSYQQFWFRSFGFQSSKDLSFFRRKTMPRLVKISVRSYVVMLSVGWFCVV